MWKSNCALDEDSAGVTVVGSRTKLGVSADWPARADIAECRLPNSGLQSPHSWQWLIQKGKKVQSLFRGSCNLDLRFGQRRGSLVEWWQLLLSPSHSNILDVTRPQTNSDSVCVSLCAGQVLFDSLLACRRNLRFNKVEDRTGQEVSSAKRLAVLVPDQMRGGVVK